MRFSNNIPTRSNTRFLLEDFAKSFDKAINAFQKVVDLKPQWPQGWDALYKAYAHKSAATEGPEAAEAAKKAEEALSMYNTLTGSGE